MSFRETAVVVVTVGVASFLCYAILRALARRGEGSASGLGLAFIDGLWSDDEEPEDDPRDLDPEGCNCHSCQYMRRIRRERKA